MYTLIKFTILLIIYCRLSHQLPVNDTFETLSIGDAYTGCAQVYRCFGLPDKCIDAKSCEVLLTAMPRSGGADFQLYWTRNMSSDLYWAGAALSADQHMGNDSVTECILWDNTTSVTARQGLTYGGDGGYGVMTVEPVKGVNNETGFFVNGTVQCSWSRDSDTKIKALDFNIMNNPYYVFLALGPMNFTTSELMHHKKISMSSDAEYLGQSIPSGNTTSTEPSNSTDTGNSTTPQASTTHSPVTTLLTTTPKSNGVTLLSQYFVSLICIFSALALKKLS